MAIRDENTATDELLLDARYHRRALESDPQTRQLAPPIAEKSKALRALHSATQDAEEERVDALARLTCADIRGDDHLRKYELEILGRCDKDRSAPGYRASLPRGLTGLIALRGEAQARETRSLIGVMPTHFPDLVERWAPLLEQDAVEMALAEPLYRDAIQKVLDAQRAEVLGRFDLVQQLRKNEGALITLYPGRRRLVRSFFRPGKRSAGGAEFEAPASEEPSADE